MPALAPAILVAGSVQAAVIIPEKAGWGGFVNLGVGGVNLESNLLAKSAFGLVDLGEERLDSLDDSPDGQSSAVPMFNFELSYTFAESRTQVYLGNLLEDFLRFDMNSLLGVRHQIGDAGIIGANLRKTSIVTEVWRDPYVIGERRQETDRNATGYAIFWQRILGSALEVEYGSVEVDIDDERSGEWLELSPGERRLLDRNGDINRLDIRYEFASADKRHLVTPGIRFMDNDRDGDAVSYDGAALGISYIYASSQRWYHVVNLAYADFDFDSVNPAFGVKDGIERIGGSLTSFYVAPFGWKGWHANATLSWFDDDHDIDFYDTSARMIGVGMLRRF